MKREGEALNEENEKRKMYTWPIVRMQPVFHFGYLHSFYPMDNHGKFSFKIDLVLLYISWGLHY
jgi:hypothetical protein